MEVYKSATELDLLLVFFSATEGDLRLRDGTGDREGRLEIYHDNQWGTICEGGFDLSDADVACRQLGFPGVEELKLSAFFGEGQGPVFLDGVECEGSEKQLAECDSNGWSQTSCLHSGDVGVVCNPSKNHFINLNE